MSSDFGKQIDADIKLTEKTIADITEALLAVKSGNFVNMGVDAQKVMSDVKDAIVAAKETLISGESVFKDLESDGKEAVKIIEGWLHKI